MSFFKRPVRAGWKYYFSGIIVITALAAPITISVGHAAQKPHVIWVKYRATPVNIAHPRFEYLDTSQSSFVTGAWYDNSNLYMIIGLSGTYYHYCRLSNSAWNLFRTAESFGRHYNAFIKGRYDCRLGGVPEYKD